MSRRPRRNHAPAFKAKVPFAAVKGDRTLTWLGWRSSSMPGYGEYRVLAREDSARMWRAFSLSWQHLARGAYPYDPALAERALAGALTLHPITIRRRFTASMALRHCRLACRAALSDSLSGKLRFRVSTMAQRSSLMKPTNLPVRPLSPTKRGCYTGGIWPASHPTRAHCGAQTGLDA